MDYIARMITGYISGFAVVWGLSTLLCCQLNMSGDYSVTTNWSHGIDFGRWNWKIQSVYQTAAIP